MKTVSWIGTIASIIGSFTLAFKFALAGYILFVIGSVSWLYVGIVRRESPLIMLNGAFLLANLIGLYNV
jgi:uncharacterized protein with PQ loop repeat